ncbi:MAG TPA: hypothetical protein VGR54_02890 [Nitrosopumilaceae archaeon]|nr:hypothetical protein [Nitrosopumilaceae archaeon]
MSRIVRIILMSMLVIVISFGTSFTLNHCVKAYPEWHEGELNINDVKPWYDMYLENDRVHMNLVITNHTNKTHTFWVIERIDSLTNHEIIKSLPNSTLYDNKLVGPNDTGVLTFSQQLPVGSWYLAIQMEADSQNGIQVDDKTQFFVVQPFSDLLLFYGMIISAVIGISTVTALLLTRHSAAQQTGELKKQTHLNEVKFSLLNRPWIGSHENLKFETSQLVLSYTNYGQLPTTNTKAQFLISSTKISRMHLHVSGIIQTLELGTIMPTVKQNLVMLTTDEQYKQATSGGEFYVGVRILYSYTGGIQGEYGVIYYYNHAANLFLISEEWTDLNDRHPIPKSDGSENDQHVGIMESEKEKPSLLNRVITEEILLLDDNGDRVFFPQINKRTRIGLTIRNNQDIIQPFAYIIQIQNNKGETERLNSVTGVILPWQSLQPLAPWIPRSSGDHTIQIFVWESLAEPRPLAHPLTITLSAIPEK